MMNACKIVALIAMTLPSSGVLANTQTAPPPRTTEVAKNTPGVGARVTPDTSIPEKIAPVQMLERPGERLMGGYGSE